MSNAAWWFSCTYLRAHSMLAQIPPHSVAVSSSKPRPYYRRSNISVCLRQRARAWQRTPGAGLGCVYGHGGSSVCGACGSKHASMHACTRSCASPRLGDLQHRLVVTLDLQRFAPFPPFAHDGQDARNDHTASGPHWRQDLARQGPALPPRQPKPAPRVAETLGACRQPRTLGHCPAL